MWISRGKVYINASIFSALLAFCAAAEGRVQGGGSEEGAHAGYVSDIAVERESLSVEIAPVKKPQKYRRANPFVVFDSRLSRELRLNYRKQFGETAAEQNLQLPQRYEQVAYTNGVRVSFQQDFDRQREFGNYVFKRLSEYHLDNFFKSNPCRSLRLRGQGQDQ